MKVVQVLFSGLGGHGSVAISMVEADAQRVWDHHLIFYGIDDVKPEYVQKCNRLKVPFAGLKKRPGLDVASERRYYRALKAAKPDVIILHSINLILPTYLYSLFHKVQVISVEHTPNQVKTRFEWIFSRLISYLGKHVVFLTEVHRNEVFQRLGKRYPAATHIIPNGIDIDRYTKSSEAPADTIAIGMMARMSDTKDQRTLIQAFAGIIADFPAARLLLAGDGPNLEGLKNYVHQEGIINVVFLGMLDEEQVVNYLNNLHLYVHSSLGETMSTSVMQAMAMSLPVIGTDIPGVNNVMQDQVNGIVVPKKQAGEMEVAIRELMTNEERRKQFALRSREIAEERLSNKVMFNAYHRLIVG